VVFSNLGIETYPDQLEPENQDVLIWRFMNMPKFRDLMNTAELYFCRADLFSNDEREGLSPEKYLPILGLNPFDIHERQELIHRIGSDAQFREGFYASCGHLFREETCKMWKDYGDQGVAICSQYRLLKSALNAMSDRAYIGLVRYGSEQPERRTLESVPISPPSESTMRMSKRSGHFCGSWTRSRASTDTSTLIIECIRSRLRLHHRMF
jgi:hypothetical protein